MGNSLVPRLENAEKTGILQLSGLRITKIPDTVKNLSNLRSLDLSTNKLEVLKPWIGRLKLLKVLNVENNKLHYFPAELCLLTKLETLNASRNLLTSLIMPGHVTNFANMQNLRFIHLSSNSLTEFPVELCSASIPINLLDLSDNQIGLIPSCVASIQAIELNLDQNRVKTIAPSIAKCPRLKVLRLEHNQLTLEAFPEEILTNSQVSSLSVSGNMFQMRELYALPSYAQYMERYTAVRKKTT
ncbi:Leucine-rich repeat-containing protein 57 [Fasciola hepatica]|uniref:Leucine-rich repeat-containing protein 57 n=1 Tax=Fasciola hepatica TaxID=6192 RepID=A0A4E0R037_FASHE|nr:Leucine-rich repeat-containing protein 57 [Fasciola hepatica]